MELFTFNFDINMKIINYIVALALSSVILISCGEDFMDTDYTRYLDGETASELAATDPSALDAYMLGAFSFMVKFNVQGAPAADAAHDDFSHMSVLHATDVMGQDIALTASHWFGYDYEHDDRMFNYRRTLVNWLTYYTIIAKANEVMDLFEEDPISAESKGVLAHGYALRGFAYYYLIQLYQHPVTTSGAVNWDAPGIPLKYSLRDGLSEEEKEERAGRNTLRMVYDQIENDLKAAVELFEAGYKRPDKNFLNASVANGLLARYYLLSQKWPEAAAAAKKAQSGYSLNTDLKDINDGFVTVDNKEWMWGFAHNTETQTTYASFFSHVSNLTPGYAGLAYSSRLIDKQLYESIPAEDLRKNWFNGPAGDAGQPTAGAKLAYANLKFGWVDGWTMNYMYMRVPEMYLIEAEALAHQGNETGAATALKPLLEARGLKPAEGAKMTVEDIYQQRRLELWGEGFSYFDLKRLNKGIDRNYAGSNHLAGFKIEVPSLDDRWIYQIPRQEMQENDQLTDADQNK